MAHNAPEAKNNVPTTSVTAQAGNGTHNADENSTSQNAGPKVVQPATGLKRWLYLAVGLVCVGIGSIGVVIRGLPTTPWLILASYCFARSSPTLDRWLKRSPVFGKLLLDWERHRGVTVHQV